MTHNKKIILILFLTLFSQNVFASNFSNQLDLSLSFGSREDNLDWNVASDITGSQTPNILSELSWSDLKTDEISLQGKYYFSGRNLNDWIVDFGLKGGVINSGKNQDSDYSGNNRTLEFSRSNNNSSDGSVIDFNIALGKKIASPMLSNKFIKTNFLPIFGYALKKQNLRITDGFQTIPADGEFDNLHSTYNAAWHSFFVGSYLDHKIYQNNLISFLAKFHYGKYSSDANWNLRSDFAHPISFSQEVSSITGYELQAQYQLHITNNIAFNTTYSYQKFSGKDGIDTIFFSNGTSSNTKLN